MSSTDSKMLKRKGADDVLADVDESKKAKPDSPTEESTENKSTSPPTEPVPPTEESTENKSTSPPIEPVPPTEESTENKSTNHTIGPDPPTEESTQNKPTKPTVEARKAEKPDSKDVPGYMQVIITGPPKCGKSCLVCSYMGRLFPTKHGEFLSKQYLHILPNSKQPVMIWDLDARNEFTKYRYQSYLEADIALLCFNVKRPKDSQGRSLENLLHPWINELYEHCGEIPIILVGLKKEFIRNNNPKCFKVDEIEKVLKRYPRIKLYKEVSAFKDKDSVKELFATAITYIAEPKPKIMYTNRG